jgi:RecA-family ATPase
MSGIRTVAQGIASLREWATDPRPRIGFGIPFLDERMRGGLARAECAMVLASSSVGKTWLGLNTIANNPGVPTLFFSIEMSWRQVVSRLTAITTGIPTWELEKQLASGEIVGPLMETIQRFPVLVGDDTSEKSTKEMSGDIKKAGQMIGHDIRLVVVDYLELIGGAGLLGKSEQVDKAAQKIRALAKDNDCSVIVLHQVSKTDGSGGHEPLSLESGKFGGHHPMDAVIGLYAPRVDRKLSSSDRSAVEQDIWVQLLKSRNGNPSPDGVRHLLDPNTGRITPYGVAAPLLASRGYQPQMVAA